MFSDLYVDTGLLLSIFLFPLFLKLVFQDQPVLVFTYLGKKIISTLQLYSDIFINGIFFHFIYDQKRGTTKLYNKFVKLVRKFKLMLKRIKKNLGIRFFTNHEELDWFYQGRPLCLPFWHCFSSWNLFLYISASIQLQIK